MLTYDLGVVVTVAISLYRSHHDMDTAIQVKQQIDKITPQRLNSGVFL